MVERMGAVQRKVPEEVAKTFVAEEMDTPTF